MLNFTNVKPRQYDSFSDFLDEGVSALDGVLGDWREDPSVARPLGYGHLLSEEDKHIIDTIPGKRTRKQRLVLEGILADGIMSAHCYPDRLVSYSRRREFWSIRSMYAGDEWTVDAVTSAVDDLVAAGYLIEHNRRAPGDRGWVLDTSGTKPVMRGTQSVYLPSPKLLQFSMPVVATSRQLLIMKSEDGDLVRYKPSARARDKHRFVEAVNRRIEEAEIELAKPGLVRKGDWAILGDRKVPIGRKRVYRVFNGGWTRNGRFVGGSWQMVPSDDRRHYVIDGERTVEVDYAQIHPRILYLEAGVPAPADAYSIPGYEDNRDICKRAFNIMINVSSFLSGQWAIANRIEAERIEAETGKQATRRKCKKPSQLDLDAAAKLIRAIKEAHSPISHCFHTGDGIRLMHLDSTMCEYVLNELVIKRGLVCLPIHDSFIVQEHALTILIRAMKDAFEHVVGKVENADSLIKVTAADTERKTMTSSKSAHIDGPVKPGRPTEGRASISSTGTTSLVDTYVLTHATRSVVEPPALASELPSEAPFVFEVPEPVQPSKPVVRCPAPAFLRHWNSGPIDWEAKSAAMDAERASKRAQALP